MSHMVQVVSMLLVMMSFGLIVFQSRLVNGAVCSGVFELERRARGVSFCGASCGRLFVMLFETAFAAEDCGRDHKRKWSPDVARRSVDCFWEDGGSQSILVTGYEQVASAIRWYSRDG
jgi:hypothetical protein